LVSHVKKEQRLRVFKARVLRGIFRSRRDEVTGEWWKLHTEALHILYSCTTIIRQIRSRRMRWAGHVARMRGERKVYRVLMGEPERKKKIFENGVLRIIFGPKRDDVSGEWRKMHNEETHNFYSSPNITRQIISRRARWAGHVVHMGENRKLHKVLVRKPEGKGPLAGPKRRWQDGIRMDLGR
jgi:hypothetical protein